MRADGQFDQRAPIVFRGSIGGNAGPRVSTIPMPWVRRIPLTRWRHVWLRCRHAVSRVEAPASGSEGQVREGGMSAPNHDGRPPTATQAVALVMATGGLPLALPITVEDAPPHRITGLTVHPVPSATGEPLLPMPNSLNPLNSSTSSRRSAPP